MRVIGSFEIMRHQAERWRALTLQHQWARTYPILFDADDLRLATGPQGRAGYHFVEWIGAILVHHLSGYHSLVSKYQYRNHPRKRQIVEQLGLTALVRRRRSGFAGTQAPDLLMYAPDLSAFFFVEVKGPGDRLSDPQKRLFARLEEETGQPVSLLSLRWGPKGLAKPR